MNRSWWFDDDSSFGELLSGDEAEHSLGIPAVTIRSWVARKKLTAARVVDTERGKGNRRRALFWEADLLAVRAGEDPPSTRR